MPQSGLMLLLVYTLFCDMLYGSWSVFCLKSLCEPFWILIYITVFYSLAPPTKRDNNINNVAKRYSQNVWELFVKPQRVFTILWKNFFNLFEEYIHYGWNTFEEWLDQCNGQAFYTNLFCFCLSGKWQLSIFSKLICCFLKTTTF